MKKICKIALISIISSSSANITKENVFNSTIKQINKNRGEFEQKISETIYQAIKTTNIDEISEHAKSDVRLEGFILYGIDVQVGYNHKYTTDIIVSLHDYESPHYYNIVQAAYYNDDTNVSHKAFSPYLSSVSIPTQGYFLLTDELKASIAANNKSALKTDFSISPLRKESLREALNHPGVKFDQLKFTKENQLTDDKIDGKLENLLSKVNKATQLKRDTHELHIKLWEILSQNDIRQDSIDLYIKELTDHMIEEIKLLDNMSTAEVAMKIKEVYLLLHSNWKDWMVFPRMLISTTPIWKQYKYGYQSIDALRARCNIYMLITLVYITDHSIMHDILEMHRIHEDITQLGNHMNMNHPIRDNNNFYDHEVIKIKLEKIIEKIWNIQDEDKKNKMTALVNDYKTKNLIEFNYLDEIGNTIYLSKLYSKINDQDLETKIKLLKLRRQSKIEANLFKHDLIFQNPMNEASINASEIPLKSLLTILIAKNNLFGTYLYNSQLGSVKDSYSHNEIEETLKFLKDNGSHLFNEKLKPIFEATVITKEMTDNLEDKDYFIAYNALNIRQDIKEIETT